MTTVLLTFDFDAVSLWISTMKAKSATPLSRGEFGARVGLPRVLDLLAEQEVKATFFVPAHTIGAFPEAARNILAQQHEIALHGYCHENPVSLAPDEEERLLDLSLAKIRSVLGNGFAPKGYRSPAWDLNPETIGFLEARNLIYDSSMMADDYRPYLAHTGFRADEHNYDRGRATNVVELPVAWELDDFPYFTFLNKPLYSGLRTPDEVHALWQEEFDFCHSLGNGVFTLTMHPQIIGRGPRIQMLRRLIEHMKSKPGTVFRTCSQEAELQLSLLSSTGNTP